MSGRAIGLATVILAVAGTAAAHHGVSGTFDESRTIKIAGVITKMELVNPHSWVYLAVKNSAGGTDTWRCEMRAGALLKRSGWTLDMFKPGTQLYIVAAPAWNEPRACYSETVTFQDGRTIERYEQLANADKGDVKRPLRTADGKPNFAGDWGAPQKLNAVNNGTNSAAVIAAVQAGRTPPAAAKLSTTEVINYGDFSKAPPNFVVATPREAPNATAARGGGMGPPAAGPGGPPAGGPPPGGARGGAYKQTEAGLAASAAAGSGRATCTATSLFSDWTMDQHVNRIQQSRDTIKIDYGYLDISRTIHLNMASHPKDLKPSKWGHSIGTWDGDTLVVDTAGFLPGPLSTGVMHSDRFHVVERFSMSADGRQLTRSWVGEDPLYLKESFKGQDVVEISQTKYEPYDCKDLTRATLN